MKNLINFFTKYHLGLLFFFLEGLSLFFLYRHSYFQRAQIVNSGNYVTGQVYYNYNNVKQYVNLKKVNEDLAKENALLHTKGVAAFLNQGKYSFTVNDTTYKQKYQWFAGKVINNSVNRRNNYLTLDRGAILGVKPEMAVVSSTGIVGIVKDVSPHFASVMSLLHKDSRISAQLKNNNYFGSLTWDGSDYRYAQLSDIPKHVPVKKGDTVTTSYYSSIFPQGLLIGVVDEFKKEPADNFYKIKVKLSTNYKNLNNVYIIENLFKAEQDTLEQHQKTADDK